MFKEFAIAMVKGIGGGFGVMIILGLAIVGVLYACKWMDRGERK